MRRMVGIQSFVTKINPIAANTTGVKLVAKDTSRHLASVYNDSTAALTILMVGDVDDASALALLGAGRKTVVIAAGGYFEFPENYVGDVWGKWASVNGGAEITEYK